MFKRIFLLSLFVTGTAQANDGVWTNTSGGDWTTPANWTTNPAGSFPQIADERAGFVGFPTVAPTITTTGNIIIGSLHLDSPSTITIDFSANNNILTFSSSGNVAELYIRGSHRIIQGAGSGGVGTRIFLDSNLDIFVDADGQPSISGSIDGPKGLSLYGSEIGGQILSLSGSNTYTGGTFVYTGTLQVGGNDGVTSIPQAIITPTVLYTITVFKGAQVQHNNNDHYAAGATMLIDGGSVTLNNTHQTMTQLTMENGGSLAASSALGTLELTQTAPGFALIVGSDAMIGSAARFKITLHGGGIHYDNSGVGTAFIAGPVTIDLGGTVELNVPHNDRNCIDLDVGETTFKNSTLNKTGNGVVTFEDGGIVPIFNIQDGTVIIGDALGPQTITATGLVTVSQEGILAGFQTLDAQAGVVNSGTVAPGSGCPCNSIGTLTITGDYTQTGAGTLLTKVSNASTPGTTSDLLVIDQGNVHLNGTLLVDTLPGGSLSVGDRILVLDNPTGTLPISGNFSSLISDLPPELSASILLEPNRVFVLIGPCTPIPPIPPSLINYVDLSLPLFTLTNEHSLQQRERLLQLRLCLPCPCNKPRTSCDDYCQPLTFYIAYLGSTANVERISTQPGYEYHSGGGIIGANYAFSRSGIGLEAGYEHVDADINAHWGGFDIRSIFASLYATFVPTFRRQLFFDAALESRFSCYDIHRHVDGRRAEGKPCAWQWGGYLDVGYDILCGHWYFTPLASIEGIYLHIDDYTENKAGDQDVHVSDQDIHSLRSWLGISMGGEFSSKCIVWIPEFRGFWLHEFEDEDRRIHVKSPAFNTRSQVQIFDAGDNFGVIGAELRALFGGHYSLTGSYDLYWNNSLQSQLFYIELGVNW